MYSSQCRLQCDIEHLRLSAVNPVHDDEESGEDRIRAFRAEGGTRLSDNPLYSVQAVGMCWPLCICCVLIDTYWCPLSRPDTPEMPPLPLQACMSRTLACSTC